MDVYEIIELKEDGTTVLYGFHPQNISTMMEVIDLLNKRGVRYIARTDRVIVGG